jgi:hypothetical protein
MRFHRRTSQTSVDLRKCAREGEDRGPRVNQQSPPRTARSEAVHLGKRSDKKKNREKNAENRRSRMNRLRPAFFRLARTRCKQLLASRHLSALHPTKKSAKAVFGERSREKLEQWSHILPHPPSTAMSSHADASKPTLALHVTSSAQVSGRETHGWHGSKGFQTNVTSISERKLEACMHSH